MEYTKFSLWSHGTRFESTGRLRGMISGSRASLRLALLGSSSAAKVHMAPPCIAWDVGSFWAPHKPQQAIIESNSGGRDESQVSQQSCHDVSKSRFFLSPKQINTACWSATMKQTDHAGQTRGFPTQNSNKQSNKHANKIAGAHCLSCSSGYNFAHNFFINGLQILFTSCGHTR